MKVPVTAIINTGLMDEYVTMNHGSGGKQSQYLVKRVFAARFGMAEPLTDSAIIESKGHNLAFTTDSYVVDPLFFPGGNIGKIAICGTVNDLAVSGANPAYISASFIIEEGFPVRELELIADTMAEEGIKAGVKIVTGDTKVVERGKCDRLFITTTGIGFLRSGREYLSRGDRIISGDKLIVNGSLGNHAIAVLGSRNMLEFTAPVFSDCNSLNHLINKVLDRAEMVHFMRDLTRGGLAVVLNELKDIADLGISINEELIPVDEPVKGLCEVLGFDPLFLANEGKVLIVAGNDECEKILEIMRSDPAGVDSAVIGEITDDDHRMVIMNTLTGGTRIIEMPSGIQLPRIC